MFVGPLAAVNDVIRARSSKGMSLLPIIMTIIASIAWFFYNIYIKEVPGIIPNGLGVILSIGQIALFIWAKKQERKLLDDTEILREEFTPVTGGSPTRVQRQRVSSLGINIPAEGP